MKIVEKVRNILIYFICFSFIGWIYEVALFLIEDHIFVNRGYYYGPWLPIYGFGGIVIYYLFYHLKNKLVKIKKINIRPLLLFIYIVITAMSVELISTYISDLVGVNWRTLWEYKNDFLNFQGRIALIPGLKFGLIGLLGVYVIIPIIDKIKNSKNRIVKTIIYIIIALFIIDVIVHIFTGSTYVGPA